MNILKLIVYPFGLAFSALIASYLLGIAVFGPDARLWFEWQKYVLSWVGSVAATAGFVFGVYLVVKDNARFVP